MCNVPGVQARQIKQCMNAHADCVSYEVLRREAQQTMDPSDPAYSMYDRQVGQEDKFEQEKEPIVAKHKKERLIVNPEFVEALDQGDGSEQFDEDYKTNEV